MTNRQPTPEEVTMLVHWLNGTKPKTEPTIEVLADNDYYKLVLLICPEVKEFNVNISDVAPEWASEKWVKFSEHEDLVLFDEDGKGISLWMQNKVAYLWERQPHLRFLEDFKEDRIRKALRR